MESFEKIDQKEKIENSGTEEILSSEPWDEHVVKANLEKYKAIWEKEKNEADKRGVNPETGRYEKGRTPIASENIEYALKRKNLANKIASGQSLTFQEKMESGRDGVLYEWNGYQLKPDCCYRKINESALRQYQETGFIDNNIDLKTLNRKDNTKIKGRLDAVDWFLGATTPRYGDILIETPASEEYFVPVEKPGEKGNLLTDTEAIHMHSSGIVNPIPMSEVRIIRGQQDSSAEEL